MLTWPHTPQLFSIKNDLQYHDIEILYFSFTVVHVVEKITTLGSANTIVIEIQAGSKSSDKSSQSFQSKPPNETTRESIQHTVWNEEDFEEDDSDCNLSLSNDETEEDEEDGQAVLHTLTTQHGGKLEQL